MGCLNALLEKYDKCLHATSINVNEIINIAEQQDMKAILNNYNFNQFPAILNKFCVKYKHMKLERKINYSIFWTISEEYLFLVQCYANWIMIFIEYTNILDCPLIFCQCVVGLFFCSDGNFNSCSAATSIHNRQ